MLQCVRMRSLVLYSESKCKYTNTPRKNSEAWGGIKLSMKREENLKIKIVNGHDEDGVALVGQRGCTPRDTHAHLERAEAPSIFSSGRE